MRGGVSVFNSISYNDLIIAFFPCIYFCANSQMLFSYGHKNYKKLGIKEKTDKILERSECRDKIHRMEPRTDGKSNTLTTVQKDNLIVGVYRTFSDTRGFRPMASNEKAPCLTARTRKDGNGQPLIIVESTLRRLTPLEMQRLQTIPEWYKFCVSDSQTNKMIGNGWTVEVIKHIFSFLP